MHDLITCPSCGAANDIGRLIGPQSNDCPQCGAQALFYESQTLKQTEHTYIEAGHKVGRAMQQKNLNRSKAAIQNFYFLLALESEADKEEARRLFSRGLNEAQRQH